MSAAMVGFQLGLFMGAPFGAVLMALLVAGDERRK